MWTELLRIYVWRNALETKGNRKVQGELQLRAAALPRHREEAASDKTEQAQIEQTYEKHKISSLSPKRGNRNAKRTEKHKTKITQSKTNRLVE